MQLGWRSAVGAAALGASGASWAGPPAPDPYAFDPAELHGGFLDADTLSAACGRELRCHEGADDLQSYCETMDVLVASGGAAAQARIAATHLGALLAALPGSGSRDEAALRRRLEESVADLSAASEMTRVAIADQAGSYGDIAMAVRNLTRARDQLTPALALSQALRANRLVGLRGRPLARLRDATGLASSAADLLDQAGSVLEQGAAPDPVATRATASRELAGQDCGATEVAAVHAEAPPRRVDPLAVGATLWGRPAPGKPASGEADPWQVRRALAVWCPAHRGHPEGGLALFPVTCALLDRAPDALSSFGLPVLQTGLRADLAALPRALGEETLRITDPDQPDTWAVRDAAASNAVLGRVVELVIGGALPPDALAALARSEPAASLPAGPGGEMLSVRRTPMAATLYVASVALAALPEEKNAALTEAVADRLWAAGALIATLSHSPGLTAGITGVWNVTPEDIQRVAAELEAMQGLGQRVDPGPGLEDRIGATFALVSAAVSGASALQAVLPGTQWPRPNRPDWAPTLARQAEALHIALTATASGDPARGALEALKVLDARDHAYAAEQALRSVSAAVAVAMAPGAPSARAALAMAGAPAPKRRLGAGGPRTYARLNLYAGAGGGVELGKSGGAQLTSPAAWPTIAAGPEIGVRLGGGALGLFAPLLDPGALATWRFRPDAIRDAGFSLLPMFTPGLDLVYALPRVPISVGAGASLVPGLRQDALGSPVTAVRGGLFVALDVPLRR